MSKTLNIAIKNQEIAVEGQITERFTRAIEHLGSSIPEVRLGGIYALERIAKDSEKDHWTIMEILISYIKTNSPITAKNQNNVHWRFDKITPDVQAVLTVLGRRHKKHEKEGEIIDLRYTYLPNADLKNADLQNAIFWQAVLNGADFKGANLEGASMGAELKNAWFSGANLKNANFSKADLEGAYFGSANLAGVHFGRANLKNASFFRPNLEGVCFNDADLTRIEDNDSFPIDFLVENLCETSTLYNAKLGSDLIKKLQQKCPKLLTDRNSGYLICAMDTH